MICPFSFSQSFLLFSGIKSVTRSITDLELALLHLQDDIEIPEIVLTIHPAVKQLISKVKVTCALAGTWSVCPCVCVCVLNGYQIPLVIFDADVFAIHT